MYVRYPNSIVTPIRIKVITILGIVTIPLVNKVMPAIEPIRPIAANGNVNNSFIAIVLC